MLGVVAVLVEVQVAVGVEHGVVQVEVYTCLLSVHPVGGEVEAVFVGAGGAAVVAVEGVEKPVVAVQPQIAVRAEAVEFFGGGGVGVGYMFFFVLHLRFVWFCKDTCFYSYFFLLKEKSNKKVQERFFVLRFAIETATGSFFITYPARFAPASRVTVRPTAPPIFCKNRLVGAVAVCAMGGTVWH